MPTVPWGATQEHILISEAKTLKAKDPKDSLAIAIRSALAHISAQEEINKALEEQNMQIRAQLSMPIPSQPAAARIQ